MSGGIGQAPSGESPASTAVSNAPACRYYQCIPGSGTGGSGTPSSGGCEQVGGGGAVCAGEMLGGFRNRLSDTCPHPPCCLQVRLWASCGGRSSPAGTNATDSSLCCPAGTSCKHYNEWWGSNAARSAELHGHLALD
jgi:hypothetical protein